MLSKKYICIMMAAVLMSSSAGLGMTGGIAAAGAPKTTETKAGASGKAEGGSGTAESKAEPAIPAISSWARMTAADSYPMKR